VPPPRGPNVFFERECAAYSPAPGVLARPSTGGHPRHPLSLRGRRPRVHGIPAAGTTRPGSNRLARMGELWARPDVRKDLSEFVRVGWFREVEVEPGLPAPAPVFGLAQTRHRYEEVATSGVTAADYADIERTDAPSGTARELAAALGEVAQNDGPAATGSRGAQPLPARRFIRSVCPASCWRSRRSRPSCGTPHPVCRRAGGTWGRGGGPRWRRRFADGPAGPAEAVETLVNGGVGAVSPRS
jgi:hypothetical protein